jgi:hypothetical protein
MSNYATYIKEKRENEERTSKNLEVLEKRLNDGYYRSM